MQPEKKPVARIIDLPGVGRVEDMVRLYFRPNEPTSPELDQVANAVSKDIFGLTEVEAHSIVQELFNEWSDLDEWSEAQEAVYNGAILIDRSDEDAVKLLTPLGLDFTDAKGWPILCTRFFKWQAFAAAIRVGGKMPDVEAAGLRKIESTLEAEARKFMERSKKGR